MAAETPVTVRREDCVDYVTLNRPAVRNALDDTVIEALTQWAETAADDRDLRVAVLCGAGKAFCSGADLSWMSHTVDYDYERNLHDAWALSRLFTRLDTLPFPLVGRLHGAALAGGVGLAAVCDIAVATEDTVFGLTEVKLGVVPAVISPFVVAKIGTSAARQLFLTGERFSARRAYELGLVHIITPPDGLDDAVERVVRELRTGGPKAIAAAKTLIAAIANRRPGDVAELAVQTISDLWVTPESQEGMRAFLDKRPPRWAEDEGT
jgi:methylglutaconyl-CoA hydratase